MTGALIHSQRLNGLSHHVAPHFSFSSQEQLEDFSQNLQEQVRILLPCF